MLLGRPATRSRALCVPPRHRCRVPPCPPPRQRRQRCALCRPDGRCRARLAYPGPRCRAETEPSRGEPGGARKQQQRPVQYTTQSVLKWARARVALDPTDLTSAGSRRVSSVFRLRSSWRGVHHSQAAKARARFNAARPFDQIDRHVPWPLTCGIRTLASVTVRTYTSRTLYGWVALRSPARFKFLCVPVGVPKPARETASSVNARMERSFGHARSAWLCRPVASPLLLPLCFGAPFSLFFSSDKRYY